MKKTKNLLCCAAATLLVLGLAGCSSGTTDGGDDTTVTTVDLTVWNGGDEQGWYASQIEAFKAAKETDTLKFNIT